MRKGDRRKKGIQDGKKEEKITKGNKERNKG